MIIRKNSAPAPATAKSARAKLTLSDGELRAVQPRARATRDAMLAAGRVLLASRDFGSLTIADIAASAGVSVGSFYGRFRDKDAYFAVLVHESIETWLLQANEALSTASARGRGSAETVADMVKVVAGIYRRNQGVIRAILKYASTHPDSWTPARQAGVDFKSAVTAVLGPQLGHIADAQRELRIQFAMQLLLGTLVNTVLNDPGPVKLADPGLERELTRALCAYLEIPL